MIVSSDTIVNLESLIKDNVALANTGKWLEANEPILHQLVTSRASYMSKLVGDKYGIPGLANDVLQVVLSTYVVGVSAILQGISDQELGKFQIKDAQRSSGVELYEKWLSGTLDDIYYDEKVMSNLDGYEDWEKAKKSHKKYREASNTIATRASILEKLMEGESTVNNDN